MTVALTGYGRYVPGDTVTGPEIAERSGIPEDVVVEKMGVREKHVCPPDDDHVTDMAVQAARDALDDADRDPADLDLVLYHGSEYKDYAVWSAAAAVADRLGADDAYASETHAPGAGAPVALRQAKALLESGGVGTALLVAASREEDLVDYADADASFTFDFGSGAAATVLESVGPPGGPPRLDGRARALVGASHAITDGSLAEDVVLPAGGSRDPPSGATGDEGLHHLAVSDPDGTEERPADACRENVLAVADAALERTGFDRSDLDFVALTHVERPFHDRLFDDLGLDPEADGYYLDDYGHVRSADQVLALHEGLRRGRLAPGDVVLFLAAGTGSTWAATVLEWLG